AARDFWMPDQLCKTCSTCELPFNFLRRRHHCRFCGQVFCHACASYLADGASVSVQGMVETRVRKIRPLGDLVAPRRAGGSLEAAPKRNPRGGPSWRPLDGVLSTNSTTAPGSRRRPRDSHKQRIFPMALETDTRRPRETASRRS
ncbi:FYVE zinc finger-domain-containing protein, partial [Pelagophyceae sp. CCMP2097]